MYGAHDSAGAWGVLRVVWSLIWWAAAADPRIQPRAAARVAWHVVLVCACQATSGATANNWHAGRCVLAALCCPGHCCQQSQNHCVRLRLIYRRARRPSLALQRPHHLPNATSGRQRCLLQPLLHHNCQALTSMGGGALCSKHCCWFLPAKRPLCALRVVHPACHVCIRRIFNTQRPAC